MVILATIVGQAYTSCDSFELILLNHNLGNENAFEKVDRTTLYRTVKKFEEKGIVHKIDDGTNITKYALCEKGCNCEIETDLHLHFHCNSCNETICLTDHKIPQIKVPNGFISEDVNLVVKGICDKCSGL